jgi:Leucine-rich repeat (LRR) protein
MVASEAEGRAEALRRIAACRTAQAEELDLGGLRLTALDGELLAGLCQLGWLRRLFLGSSGVFDEGKNAFGPLPGALFDALTRLEWLDLSFNFLPGLPASIANLTKLTRLNLVFNKIGDEGAQALTGLTALTSLNLDFNRIGDEGAQALTRLTKLTSLSLAFNQIGDGGPQALKGLTKLTILNLSGNKRISHEGAQALKGLTKRTSLDLSGNEIGAERSAGAQGPRKPHPPRPRRQPHR